MAKVVIEADSADRSVKVSVDGKSLKDVVGAYISTSPEGYFNLELTQSEPVDDTMQKITRLCAYGSQEWQEDNQTITLAIARALFPKRDL